MGAAAAEDRIIVSTNIVSTEEVATTPGEAADTIFRTILRLWTEFLEQLPLIGAGIAVVLLTWAFAALLKRTGERFLPRKRFRASLRELIVRLAVIGVWIIGRSYP